ncbi:MAG: metallophosphoesterase [Spirochaetales bacterium]|nr:metallophosphoesterase [Spirochaetales bacterium]
MKETREFLCIADHVDPLIYTASVKERFGHVDAVFSCGDLKRNYYEFIVSMLNVPFIYVLGNHSPFSLDKSDLSSDYDFSGGGCNDSDLRRRKLFGGGLHVDGRVTYLKKQDLIAAGFGGSIRYNQGDNQYSEVEMFFRILKIIPKLYFNKIFRGRYLDILITHAPPRWVNDREDLCHHGFKVFRWFLRRFRPACMIHGHIHLYDCNAVRETSYEGVPVINVYDHYILKFPLERKDNEKSEPADLR